MKKVKYVSISALLIICAGVNASYSAQYWAKTYGGSDMDAGTSVKQTSDDGFIVLSGTRSFGAGETDRWLLKLNSVGDVSWSKTYGGGNSDIALREGILQTSDGGYIMAGSTLSLGTGNWDIFVLKLDSIGQIMWQNTYGDTDRDLVNSIQQTSDGGYIVAGETGSFGAGGNDILVLKMDSNGNVGPSYLGTWQRTYGGNDSELAWSIQQTSDGGYIVLGETESFGTDGGSWVLKLDSAGAIEWQKLYRHDYDEQISSIQQTQDGGYILAGYIKTPGMHQEDVGCLVLKLTSTGVIEWQKGWGLDGYMDYAFSVQQSPTGKYIVAGVTYSFSQGSSDILILELNSNGSLSWQKTYGGNMGEEASVIQNTSDGGYVVVGSSLSFGVGDYDTFVLKFDSMGEIPFSDCNIISKPNISLYDTYLVSQDTDATITQPNVNIDPISFTVLTPEEEMTVVCCYDSNDYECDGVPNLTDNCPDHPNGFKLGSCSSGTIGEPCMRDTDCGGEVDSCSMNQEDTYPPGGNGIGDVCDCEANFDCDLDVDAEDLTEFLYNFGRNQYHPYICSNSNPCPGDFTCDTDVDGADITKFLEDFGRGQYDRPCPACDGSPWCVY